MIDGEEYQRLAGMTNRCGQCGKRVWPGQKLILLDVPANRFHPLLKDKKFHLRCVSGKLEQRD